MLVLYDLHDTLFPQRALWERVSTTPYALGISLRHILSLIPFDRSDVWQDHDVLNELDRSFRSCRIKVPNDPAWADAMVSIWRDFNHRRHLFVLKDRSLKEIVFVKWIGRRCVLLNTVHGEAI